MNCFKPVKSLLFILLLLTTLSLKLESLDMELPDSLFTNLELSEFSINDTVNQKFYIEYPEDYNINIKYPVFIGLAGGNQSNDIVLYCYAVYFKTTFFNKYIRVFPISSNASGFLSYDKKYLSKVLDTIEKNLPTTNNKWIIAGTSNGGIASIDIVSTRPELFSGLITMPGIINGENSNVNSNWSHIKALLVCGEEDSEGWKQGVVKTNEIFKSNSIESKTLFIPNQGHILEMGFDVDLIYEEFNKIKVHRPLSGLDKRTEI